MKANSPSGDYVCISTRSHSSMIKCMLNGYYTCVIQTVLLNNILWLFELCHTVGRCYRREDIIIQISQLLFSLLWAYSMRMLHKTGFSVNNSLLLKEHLTLGEQTMCTERILKEAIRLFSSVTIVQITNELVASSRRAQAEYVCNRWRKKLTEVEGRELKKTRIDEQGTNDYFS